MTLKTALHSDQFNTLVSLPYRVGVLVSDCDAAGGGIAQDKEREVLKQILAGYADQMLGSESIQEIIQETVNRQQDWPSWQGKVDAKSVLEDCAFAMHTLSEHAERQDLKAYKSFVFGIAEAVAMAFREYASDLSFSKRIYLYLLFNYRRLRAASRKKPYKTFDQFLNISIKEHQILERIADSLGADYV